MKPTNRNIRMIFEGKIALDFWGVVEFYPNPFEDYFIFERSRDDEIIIQEPSGRILLQQRISKRRNRIRSEKLSAGMYFVHFVGQNKTFKIVKQ